MMLVVCHSVLRMNVEVSARSAIDVNITLKDSEIYA